MALSPYDTRALAILCNRSPSWVTRMARLHGIGKLIRLPNAPGRGMWTFGMEDWVTMAKLCRYNKGGK